MLVVCLLSEHQIRVCLVTTLPWSKVDLVDLNYLYAPLHHEHVIEHHYLLRIVNEGEVATAEPVVEEIIPQTTAEAYFISGFSEAPDSTPSDQGKPRCI